MIIFITYDNYMKATGCGKTTMFRRIRQNVLTSCNIKLLALHGIMYDTNMNNSCRKYGDNVEQMRPTSDQLVELGVDHRILTDTSADMYDQHEVAQKRHTSGTYVAQMWHKSEPNLALGANTHASPIPHELIDTDIVLHDNERHLNILRMVREAMLRPEASRKTTGDIKLHRKMLNNTIMESSVLSYVFIELMLMASTKGEVEISSPLKSVKNIGAEAYTTALMHLEQKHGAVKVEIRDETLFVKLVKWNSYQPVDIDNVVIRDMDHPEVEISPEDNNQSFPPEPPLSTLIDITPYSPPNLKKDTYSVNSVSMERSPEPEPTTTPAPASKKRREKKLKEPRDPYKLEDYPTKYRPYVPDGHEIYEYYRDKLGVSSARITAIDRIVPLLTVYPKETIIEAIDNYYSDVRQMNREAKHIKRAETFFQDYYTAYLTSELPKTKQKPPQGAKSRKPDNVEVIHIGEHNE